MTTAPFLAALLALAFAAPAAASGLMTCDADPKAWKPREQLVQQITAQGWKVRKAEVDGGCYEVYGTTPGGDRVEAYFHPVTFEKLLVTRRGAVLFKKGS